MVTNVTGQSHRGCAGRAPFGRGANHVNSGWMMHLLTPLLARPEPFSRYTHAALWDDAHVSERMLAAHLDERSDRASRRPAVIDAIVERLDLAPGLSGKRVCDLGCGPGLYCARFHRRGASVVGIDLSRRSIAYAREQAQRAGQDITYVLGNYRVAPLPAADVYTLIYHDYATLGRSERVHLLRRVRAACNPGAHLVLDVPSELAFARFETGVEIATRLMDGFWSAGDYLGVRVAHRYDGGQWSEQPVSLHRYLILEPPRVREVLNWLRYFSPEFLRAELRDAGFEVSTVTAGLAGGEQLDGTLELAAVAKAV